MFRAFRTNETADAFSTLTLRLKNVWGNWNTSMPGEVEKGLQVAVITQCKYYPASTEKNSEEESRLGGSQSSLNHQFVDCSQTQLRLEKKSAVRKESEIPFVSPVACGWLELQAAFLVIVCSCFVCKSENCNNISYSQRRFRSREKVVWMFHLQWPPFLNPFIPYLSHLISEGY